ncbi:hypothetical protein E2C01_064404 [Portunus trituberculatus]|uniref:Uncharacterized protein n=1 Tax=Portunus trituberculatus TaxID=210409 RepID=A0A5B7HNN8_PORTR|nr:hypothetical protein [Portunus trituberculatus]
MSSSPSLLAEAFCGAGLSRSVRILASTLLRESTGTGHLRETQQRDSAENAGGKHGATRRIVAVCQPCTALLPYSKGLLKPAYCEFTAM